MTRLAVLLALAAALALATAAPAVAAPATEVVQGDVLRIESVQDAEALRTMQPGVPVAWDVGVSASEPTGSIDVALSVTTTPEAYRAAVLACSSPWTATGCAGDAQTLVDVELADGAIALATQPADAERWYRIEVELLGPTGGATATLTLTATGAGETVASDGDVTLPPTGQPVVPAVAIAATAVAAGIALAGLARRRRQEAGA